MYGHYDYGSHHNVGGSSSQPNVCGSLSQPNFGGSSSQPYVGSSLSQPNFRGSSSSVRQFSLENEDFTNLYSPQFSESFRKERSPVEEIEEFQVPLRRRSRPEDVKQPQRRGHRRKKPCTLVEPATHYLQMALIDYQAEYGVPFTLLHCWEVLKDSEKWNSDELLAFRQEREDGKNKRYKSSGSSSFNMKDSGEGSINLNTKVGIEDENKVEEVEEVHRPRPMGRDQAKRKMKAGSASSGRSFDVAELAKMMASEYVMASDPYNTQKKQEMSKLLKIKNRELELKAAELEIRRMENYQRDEVLYETTTDKALKEKLR
nr:hypothetical protein [Tanacetum cinerariifolium]